jgi:hypothetical protein
VWDQVSMSEAWAIEQAMGLVWYYEVSNSLVSLWGRRTLDRLLHEGGRCKHSRRHEGDFGNAKHRRFAPARRHGVSLTRPTNSSLQVIR